MFEYLQVLEVIPAGKAKKPFEMYRGKQYLKARLDCYKTTKFGSLYSRGKKPKYFLQKFLGTTYLLERVFLSFNSLLYINVCFMAMILHVYF